MKTKLEVIKELIPEVDRLKKKLLEAVEELKNEPDMHVTRAYSAARRSALDVKKILTNLTQDSEYRWRK